MTLVLCGSNAPCHLRGLNELIGVKANKLELIGKIAPPDDKLYAVLPAGVATMTPSLINSFICVLLLILIVSLADWWVSLSIETSFIAIALIFLWLRVSAIISNG